ncbi:hypothetical protein FRX31_027107, partial [Thalictrum thalictroides]
GNPKDQCSVLTDLHYFRHSDRPAVQKLVFHNQVKAVCTYLMRLLRVLFIKTKQIIGGLNAYDADAALQTSRLGLQN